MTTDKHFNLINEGIQKLGTALFCDFNPSILKFPTSVITISWVDNAGNIWFTVKKPYKDISEFDKEFSSQLQFYNKNYNYYITVQGKAAIMNGHEIPADEADKLVIAFDEILIRLQIFTAEYFYSSKNEKPGLSDYIDKFLNWLLCDKKQNHEVTVRY